ncbi:MAG: hypothetical protein LLF98_01895 [Clostridium sp.]|uniref:hypothetical protein n=1 Tax=Clostridium sp. TaxID=1506 RepID=UPI0025C0BD35|nr:hypothetical protein [Clostridium sp.]MCE5220033.1 hypothetical protein [Clostridium sp.]
MTNIIKQIRKIIGNFDSSDISIHIAGNEIWFYIYESEVPIIIDLKNNNVYVDCETMSHQLTSSMLYELHMITELLNDNLDVFRNLLK